MYSYVCAAVEVVMTLIIIMIYMHSDLHVRLCGGVEVLQVRVEGVWR